MKKPIQIKLNVSDDQSIKLHDLQKTFAMACDEAALFVNRSRSWHRVTLHHLAYKTIREKFPKLGSQLVCNAIHAVSKASKEIFQNPTSQWSEIAKSGKPLPILKFSETMPVFFDRHTLTLKNSELSIYTLDGRMSIQINLSDGIGKKLKSEKIKELSMHRLKNSFYLRFVFNEENYKPPAIESSVKVINEKI
jgi:predicted transposase